MTKTVPGIFDGNESLGYAYLALLSADAKEQVRQLLDSLCNELPGLIRPMPLEQLHITLCEIVQPKEYSQDKELLFTAHREEYINKPIKFLGDTNKFIITFDTIEASTQAIIIRARDSNEFNSIRAKIVANLELPEETRTPPDITHSSIARM